jgi:hypothetical protein
MKINILSITIVILLISLIYSIRNATNIKNENDNLKYLNNGLNTEIIKLQESIDSLESLRKLSRIVHRFKPKHPQISEEMPDSLSIRLINNSYSLDKEGTLKLISILFLKENIHQLKTYNQGYVITNEENEIIQLMLNKIVENSSYKNIDYDVLLYAHIVNWIDKESSFRHDKEIMSLFDSLNYEIFFLDSLHSVWKKEQKELEQKHKKGFSNNTSQN